MNGQNDENDFVTNNQSWRESKSLLLITVAIALFLDNILVSAVVPILPQHLREIELAAQARSSFETIYQPSNLTEVLKNAESSNSSSTLSSEIMSNKSFAYTKNENISSEGTKFGFLLGSKPLLQLIANPFVGSLAYRFGYRRIMLTGFVLLFFSTLLFAYGESYEILFFARSLQGLASSCTSVTGMATLAKRFTVDKKRQNAMRIAMGGIALGLSLGPPYGGASYQYLGKKSPFLMLCGLTLIDGCMLLIISEPKTSGQKEQVKQTSFFKLIRDPYILITAVAEATLPLWMWDTMKSTRLQVGLAFVSNPICFILIMNVLGKLFLRFPRWLLIVIGGIFSGLCLALYPFCQDMYQIIAPSCIMGIGAALMELALMPEFAHLVDIRHTAEYGNVYAISDVAVCLGLWIAPSSAGFLYQRIGFNAVMFGSAFICFLYAPLGYFLKNPPARNKQRDSSEAPTTDKLLEEENLRR
ncbi:hypothetical protein V9T40_001508 [Parthenolecanium corni]|uniref:Major facilitator superfamily (MFS) profile domain-containing protein n=1 Tax=Parthenolecanium corni TaxID=536013 RepID=A0AAN9TI49_9HEMI